MGIEAVIFDLDGTLLDSIGVWRQIDIDFLKKRGLQLPEDYIRVVAMMHLKEAAVYTIRRFGLRERPADLVSEWRQMAYDAYAQTVPLKSGAADYLRGLKLRDIRLAVATALDRTLAEVALHHHGIAELFDTVTYAADVGQGKGSPAVFLSAAEALRLSPAACAVFEDTLAGVRSAKAAGMLAFAVKDSGSAEDWATICAVADECFENFTTAPLIFEKYR